MAAIVLPWNEFSRVIILYPSFPFFVNPYFLAVFIAASFASAPEFPKNTFDIPLLSVSISATLTCGLGIKKV